VLLHTFVGGIPADRDESARGDDIERALVAAEPGPGAPERLRDLLKDRLPRHMIPTSWVVLDALPLTDNGKVDRKNLPEPIIQSGEAVSDAMLTSTEAKLLALARDLLGRAIGIDRGFFDAGGDSLLLLDLQKAVQREFDLEVPLTDFFQYATIRSLGQWLDQGAGRGGDAQ
jgi:acyl carrier protein